MSENKCFCHLNGFEVKDANARKNIETLTRRVDELENNAGGGGKLYYHNLSIDFGGSDGGMCITFLSRNSAAISSWNEIYNLQNNNRAKNAGYFKLDTDFQYKGKRGYAVYWQMGPSKETIGITYISSYTTPPATNTATIELTNCSFIDDVIEV